MKIFPYHDAGGRLYPELDARVVDLRVMAAYESVSPWTAFARATRGDYGKTKEQGCWLELRAGGPVRGTAPRGRWRFRSAVIYRRLRSGRYAGDPAFDPRQLDGRFTIFCCDPAATAARSAPPAGVDPQAIMATQAGTQLEVLSLLRRLLGPMPGGVTVPFPAPVIHPQHAGAYGFAEDDEISVRRG